MSEAARDIVKDSAGEFRPWDPAGAFRRYWTACQPETAQLETKQEIQTLIEALLGPCPTLACGSRLSPDMKIDLTRQRLPGGVERLATRIDWSLPGATLSKYYLLEPVEPEPVFYQDIGAAINTHIAPASVVNQIDQMVHYYRNSAPMVTVSTGDGRPRPAVLETEAIYIRTVLDDIRTQL